jgi:UDP-N-acetylglucosamine kinase
MFLPQYQKTSGDKQGNAHVVQKAANKGLDILREYCLKHEISFLHDGTFGNYTTMHDLVKESIKKNRFVQIYFLYLDPVTAWNFTKARERIEGRNIIKEKFIDQFFSAKENVQKIKRTFGPEVSVVCVLKDAHNHVRDIKFNVSDIDQYMKSQYSKGIVREYTREVLESLLT